MNIKSQAHNSQKSNSSIPNQRGIEHRVYEGIVKKQSIFLQNWNKIKIILIESPHQELMMTIKNIKESRISQIINLSHSRLSNSFSKIDNYHCFGVIIPSKKKYYFACKTAQDTISLYAVISKLTKQIRIKNRSQINNTVVQFPKKIVEVPIDEQLSKSLGHRYQSNSSISRQESIKSRKIDNPTSTTKLQRKLESQQSFVSAIQDKGQNSSEGSVVNYKSLHKLTNTEQIKERSKFHKKKYEESIIQPLVIQQPISFQEVQCFQSDQGFKLLHNFNNGRLLAKSQKYIKASLVTITDFSVPTLLQSFFHLQLWNQRVKYYKVITRIDKGILLVKLQFHKRNFFSLPKYCYMMVTTCKVKGQFVVVFRSLQESTYEKQFGYSWININLWVKAQQNKQKNKKIIQICGSFQNQKDFQEGIVIFEQIKNFQIFLETTGKLPKQILEWKDQINEIDNQYI